jgi:hypothetical protein
MKQRLSTVIAATTLVVGSTIAFAGPASAAHCTDNGGPGHSDFATHVQATNGPGAHNEGDHKGWASCEENSNNFGG